MPPGAAGAPALVATKCFPRGCTTGPRRIPSEGPVSAYAIDDETAIKVVGSTVEVVSEGQWQLFNSRANASDVS